MPALFVLLGKPFRGLPFCSLPGALVGSFVGFAMSYYQAEGAFVLDAQQTLAVGLLLGAAGWLLVLLVYGALLRYGVGQILWPALVNALVTALLTVAGCNAVQIPPIEGLLGLLLGVLVGALLCALCRRGWWWSYGPA